MITLVLWSILLCVLTLSSYKTVKIKYRLISAPIFVNLFSIFYVCIGAYLFFNGDYIFLGTNYNQSIHYTYLAAAIFNTVFTLSFIIFSKRISGTTQYRKKSLKSFDEFITRKYNWKTISIYCLFFSALVLVTLNDANFGVLKNLLMIFFNGLIPIIVFSLVYKIRLRIFWVVLFSLISIYLGFRYRLILLFYPIFIYYFAINNANFYKVIKYASVLLIVLGIISIVGISRQYSNGLDINKLKEIDYSRILVLGIFNDTSTVLTSGEFIKIVEQYDLYAYFMQIYYIISYFFPKTIWVDKVYSPIFEIIGGFTGFQYNENGSAILGYAEYFHTGGYFGLIFFGVFFAWLTAIFFKKFAFDNCVKKFDLMVYAIIVSWFINSLTRGYLPQNVQDLLSLAIGIYIFRSKIFIYRIKSFL